MALPSTSHLSSRNSSRSSSPNSDTTTLHSASFFSDPYFEDVTDYKKIDFVGSQASSADTSPQTTPTNHRKIYFDDVTDEEDVMSQSSRCEKPEFSLLAYARANNTNKLAALLTQCPSIDINFKGTQKQNFSWTALHLASYFGHVEFVDKLLSLGGINVDVQNSAGDTPLHKAALTDRTSIVQKLLSKGANVFILNLNGYVAKQLTTSSYIRNMIEATEKVDQRKKQELIEASGQAVMSKSSLVRFEGPLLRKMRMFGPSQTYVVLENGTLLLFRTRKDFINRSLRAYKYLEGAVCAADEIEACFHIEFSDQSKVTFMIAPKDADFYSVVSPNQVPKSQEAEQRKSSIVIELIRLRWIHAINDHIRYCAQFTKDGRRRGVVTDDKMFSSISIDGMSNLNSVQAAIQEAVAHLTIFNRHADSLNTVVKKKSGLPSSYTEDISSISASTSNQTDTDKNKSGSNQQQIATSTRLMNLIAGKQTISNRTQDNSIDSNAYADFIQNWPGVLFHLKLLLESSQHTKESLQQALILMESQEKIRLDRLKHLTDRCRILEESLHSINHHELEKSKSHVSLATSMSTDINSYYDAFEDFDDARTLTPEDNDDRNSNLAYLKHVNGDNDDDDDGQSGNDNMSSCSALTIGNVNDL